MLLSFYSNENVVICNIVANYFEEKINYTKNTGGFYARSFCVQHYAKNYSS